jgi:hypothetical protein
LRTLELTWWARVYILSAVIDRTPRHMCPLLLCTPSVPKYLHLLISALHI